MDQRKMPLFEALKAYKEGRTVPFDVPGHKNGKGIKELASLFGNDVLEVDVNSMKCLDHLGHPTGVIKEAQALMAEAFQADGAFFMVNGATAGVMAMIQATCSPGDKIIMPRNVHKSALNGLIQSGAKPVYIMPDVDRETCITLPITFDQVVHAIDKHPDAKAIFLLNPTYFGFVTELERITDYAHSKGILVLVDEAHGSHFGFHSDMPISAMEAGADMSCVSLHKTGGSLTQSSALLTKGRSIDKKHVRKIINLSQSTSASYLLLASLDVARKQLALEGERMISDILQLAETASRRINNETIFATLDASKFDFERDPSKLVIHASCVGISGLELYNELRDNYDIQLELGDEGCALAIISLGDDSRSIDALIQALSQFETKSSGKSFEFMWPEDVMCVSEYSPREAFYAAKESVELKSAVGKIAGESIMAYPPGIPLLMLGEVISKKAIELIEDLVKHESLMTDMEDETLKNIVILKTGL